jgi:PAS domain S-box-containing protein
VSAGDNEENLLRSVALQNAQSILAARQRAEEDLLRTKQALELKTEELANSLAMLNATLEAATDGILVTDRKGHVTGFNQRFVELWRIPPKAMDSREHRQILEIQSEQFDAPQKFISRFDEIYESAPPETMDLLELADGRIFEQLTRIQIVDGQGLGRVWSLRDITERRHAEETRFRLAAIVESSDDAIVSKTLDGIITTWNQGAQRMFGYAAGEVIGKPITILMPPERVSEEAAFLARLRRGERIEHYETVRMRKDGSLLDVSLTVSPVKAADGSIIGISKIARDITARKRMEDALQDETRILDVLNKTGPSIASRLDLQDLIQSVTDAATELSGAKFGAFFYNSINENGESFLLYTLSGAPREAFEKFGLPRNTPVFNPTFRGEGVVRSPDITKDPRYGTMSPHHGMPSGHLPVRSYLAVPVGSRSGEVIGGLFFGHPEVGVFTERAERLVVGVAAQAAVAIDNARLYDNLKKAALERERLLEAERVARTEAERVSFLKDEFLATLSHELRTPLNAILGWAQILHSRPGKDADLQQGLEVIQRNTKVQAQLIEDLLDMSRIISGKIRLDVQLVDLQDVVNAAVASVRHSAEAKDIRLQVVLDPLDGPVRGDPNRLQQCFWNLLATPSSSHPKVERCT